MKRFSVKKDGHIQLDPVALENGDLARQLYAMEQFLSHLQNRKAQIPGELEVLRAENKAKTYRFRELMTEQMTTDMVMDLLKLFDVEM